MSLSSSGTLLVALDEWKKKRRKECKVVQMIIRRKDKVSKIDTRDVIIRISECLFVNK